MLIELPISLNRHFLIAHSLFSCLINTITFCCRRDHQRRLLSPISGLTRVAHILWAFKMRRMKLVIWEWKERLLGELSMSLTLNLNLKTCSRGIEYSIGLCMRIRSGESMSLTIWFMVSLNQSNLNLITILKKSLTLNGSLRENLRVKWQREHSNSLRGSHASSMMKTSGTIGTWSRIPVSLNWPKVEILLSKSMAISSQDLITEILLLLRIKEKVEASKSSILNYSDQFPFLLF